MLFLPRELNSFFSHPAALDHLCHAIVVARNLEGERLKQAGNQSPDQCSGRHGDDISFALCRRLVVSRLHVRNP